jgi:hypothetical protein
MYVPAPGHAVWTCPPEQTFFAKIGEDVISMIYIHDLLSGYGVEVLR